MDTLNLNDDTNASMKLSSTPVEPIANPGIEPMVRENVNISPPLQDAANVEVDTTAIDEVV